MATNNQNIPRRPLTEFAQKYGVFKNRSQPAIIHALQGYKSGHTPVSANKPDDSANREEWKKIIEDYQFGQAQGFPMGWIRALGAYIPTAYTDFAAGWPKTELHNSIHPLIDGREWETLDRCSKSYPPPLIGNGRSGFMVADNEIIWDVLKPILQLTSRYLDNAHLWPWWDALLSEANSDNKITEESPSLKDTQNLCFRMRTGEEVSKQTVQVKDLLRAMAGHWHLRLRSMCCSPSHGGPQDGDWFGVTMPFGGPGKGTITLGAELIRALLTKDLKEPERIMLVTFCARTLAHEIAHAAAMHYQRRCDPRVPAETNGFKALPEAYFQDEALNELGHSMEQNVFKSDHLPIMSNTDGLMLMMINADFPFPKEHQASGFSQYLPPGKDLEPHAQARTLVPIEWMRMLLFPDFWDHYINRYGGDGINPDKAPAARIMLGNKYRQEYGDLLRVDLGILSDLPITANMSPEGTVACQLENMRRNMQRVARDRLEMVAGEYTIDPKTGVFSPPPLPILPPPQEEPSNNAPGGSQAQETAQIQGGPQVQGQPPAPLPQGQEAPARAPRDPPTPTSVYVLPDDIKEPLKASEVHAATRIATLLKYFRNVLGLHCIATCTEDALLFNLALLAKQHFQEDVTTEDWAYFLRACSSAEKMITWDSKTKLIHALKVGWEPSEPELRSPLPRPGWPEATLEPNALYEMIDHVRSFILSCAGFYPPNAVTWYDDEVVAFHFNALYGCGVSTADFKGICLTYFSSCWTTGPPGCMQYNAPNYLEKMAVGIDEHVRSLSESIDIGAAAPTGLIQNAINVAFEGVGVPEKDKATHPRHLLEDNRDWWQKALLELLPDYFSITMDGGQMRILFTYIGSIYSNDELLDHMTEEQAIAFYDFVTKYWEVPTAKRKIWPSELRNLYNSYQTDESLKIKLPRVFFSCLCMPSKYSKITPERQVEFAPAPEPAKSAEGANTQGQNAQGGAQGGGQEGNQGGTQGGPQTQEGFQAQGGPQVQGGPQIQGGPQAQGGFQTQGGFQAQGGPQVQGGPNIPIPPHPPTQGWWWRGN
ncbi:hypothetical protein V502_05581 [Pseudogymnoascus sp. VKM F-4520 (FW-2644)]|nr:hypothetical protein V502_05581 [Pseudogymnoascus sp. VKM F-4520 (FW-2644)]